MDSTVQLQDYYFEQQDMYTKIYGEKTIVFMQVGKFYESYCRQGSNQGYQDLEGVEKIIEITFIKRPNNGPKSKPSQLGIPCTSIANRLSTLVKHGFTIVLFDQFRDPTATTGIGRKKVGVFSPGTHVEDKYLADTNYILSVYIVEEIQLKQTSPLLAIGLTLMDVTTGHSMVHEFYGDECDERFGLDELNRIITMFRPTESVFYFRPIDTKSRTVLTQALASIKSVEKTVTSIKTYLELHKHTHRFYVYQDGKASDQMELVSDKTFKISFQNDYFAKIYDLHHRTTLGQNRSPIEIIGLERKPYAVVSLVIMLQFVTNHNINLLKNISPPTTYTYSKHLILENDAIEQLNVIDSNNLESYNKQFESLFDVVNKTSTPMGRRFLKETLMNPFSQEDKKSILQRYEYIEAFMENSFYLEIKEELRHVFDIHRLHRKMATGTITPYHFYRLDTFYRAITKIFGKLKSNEKCNDLAPIPVIKEFIKFQKSYREELDMDELQKYHSCSDITDSIYKKGVHPKIDELKRKITTCNKSIDVVVNFFNTLSPNSKYDVKLKNTQSEGYYLTVVKSQEADLKSHLKKLADPILLDVPGGEGISIEKSTIQFKSLSKGRTKIFIDVLQKDELEKLLQRLVKLTEKIFSESVSELYAKHNEMLSKVTSLISLIDFLVSGATVAKDYFYCKPVIKSEKNIPSYFIAKELRHALVERINQETEYIPTDIELGNVPNTPDFKQNGIFLLGVNASGKSNLMKSIGLAVILAQIGYYVPATSFVYEPYMSLFTRITGNDNILKGLSTYALEMVELDAIINRTSKNGENTLVIGDEVCRGTDKISAYTLVTAALIHLSKHNTTFIFSSHFHDITDFPEVKNLENVKIYHLRVECDQERDCFVYDRKLTSGPGPNFYGLTVSKFLIKNREFLHLVETLKQKLVPTDSSIITVPNKTSKYNSNLVMSHCAICYYRPISECHKELDTHHINFQKNCWSDGKIKIKPHLTKDELYNLVVLCKKCHDRVHRSVITIHGYLDTSAGPMLSYKIDIIKDTMDRLEAKNW